MSTEINLKNINTYYTQACYKPDIKDLQKAISRGDRDLIDSSLPSEDLNKKLANGYLPLHFAVLENQKEIVQKFLEMGADPSFQDDRGLNALDHAAILKNKELTALLISHKINIDLEKTKEAIKSRSSVEFVKRWAKELQKKKQLNPSKLEAVYRDSFKGCLSEISSSLINRPDASGFTPLHYAILGEKIETVRFLINQGADLSINTKEGASYLHFAAALEDFEIVKELIERGMDPLSKEKGRISSLMILAVLAQGKDPLQMTKSQKFLFTVTCLSAIMPLVSSYAWVSWEVGALLLDATYELFRISQWAEAIFNKDLNALFSLFAIGVGHYMSECFPAFRLISQALLTTSIARSAWLGIKTSCQFIRYRTWDAVLHMGGHTVNMAGSFYALKSTIESRFFPAKIDKQETLKRLSDPELNPKIPNHAMRLLNPHFDHSRANDEIYIIKQFRATSKVVHTDKSKDKATFPLFIKLTEAKETLLDRIKLPSRLSEKTEEWRDCTEKATDLFWKHANKCLSRFPNIINSYDSDHEEICEDLKTQLEQQKENCNELRADVVALERRLADQVIENPYSTQEDVFKDFSNLFREGFSF